MWNDMEYWLIIYDISRHLPTGSYAQEFWNVSIKYCYTIRARDNRANLLTKFPGVHDWEMHGESKKPFLAQ